MSLPLRGPSGPDGRDAADGARMALADANDEAGGVAVEAKYLDDTAGGRRAREVDAGQAAANARAATQDSTAIAYLGDFESGATRASLPVTNGARCCRSRRRARPRTWSRTSRATTSCRRPSRAATAPSGA